MLTLADLQQFCNDHSERIGKPFAHGDYTWATDGRILVRVPLIEGTETVELPPNVEKVWKDELFDVPMRALDVGGLPVKTTKTDVCDECGGDPLHSDCPSCSCVCDECGGTGNVLVNSDQGQQYKIGAVNFALHYVRRLATLPGVEVAADPMPEKPMPFRFDGGAGLLMPLRTE